MKPTQLTELLANIKATFVSFFSILMFVALGVGVFVGIYWAAPALQTAAEKAFDEGAMHDVQVQFPYGLTDDDLSWLKTVDGVEDVEVAHTSDQQIQVGESEYTLKVQTMGKSMNTPIVREGELPRADDEVALRASFAEKAGISVGDTITLKRDEDEGGASAANDSASAGAKDGSASSASAGASASSASASAADDGKSNQDGMKTLTRATFKVTALADSPEYIAVSMLSLGTASIGTGTYDGVIWVNDSVFDGSAYFDGYPIVNVRVKDVQELSTFTKEYEQAIQPVVDAVQEHGDVRGDERSHEMHDQFQAKIDDGQKKLDEAKQEVADGEQKIKDGEAELKDKEQELEDGKATVAEAKERVKEGRPKLEEAKKLLDEKQAEFDKGKEEFDKKEAELQEAQDKYDEAMDGVDEAYGLIDELERRVGDIEKEQDKLTSDYEKDLDRLERDYDKGDITEKEFDQLTDDLDKEHEAAIAEGNDEIDDLCDEVTRAVEDAADEPIPQVLDHNTVDVAIPAARALLDNIDDQEIEFRGETMTVAEARDKLNSGWDELEEAREKLNSGAAELQGRWDEYYSGEEQLRLTEEQIEEGEQKIADGEEQLAQGKKDLEDAKKQLEDGKKQVKEKEANLEQAKKQLSGMKDYAWTVLPRKYNGGYTEVSTFSDVTNNLSFSMAALFVIVGLLVTYSAVSRIVHEQIAQIGTKKALGLRSREVTTSFMMYSAIAVVVGSIAGVIIGVVIVEGIIDNALGGRFVIGNYPPYFGLPLALLATLAELVLVLASTWIACHSILKKHAVELLRGEEPPKAKERFFEKWAIWEKLPLYTQTIVNNCLNDKRRVFSTVVGVAGCTALIITAITLNNDVLKSYDRHYDEVYGFDSIAFLDKGVEGAADNVLAKLGEAGYDAAAVLRTSVAMTTPDGSRAMTRVIVPMDDDAFAKVYSISPIEGQGYDPEAQGVWISHAYATHFGAKVGDMVNVSVGDGKERNLPIIGIDKFFLTYHEMIMGRAYFQEQMEAVPEPDVVLVRSGDAGSAAVQSALEGTPGFSAVFDDKSYQYENFAAFSSVSSAVVIVYIALSILMAIVVLLNLNVMFIEEKKRDLIVLMINGFSTKDAKRYIYNDSIVLTAIGIACGVVLGCAMGAITVGAIEPSTASFVKDVDAVAVIAGIVGSAVLALIMSIIALRRIPRFNLTDINKF